jgi:hypothetical protein
MEQSIIKYHVVDNSIPDELSSDENYNIIQTIIDENKYAKDTEIIVKIASDNEIIKHEWKFIKQLKKYVPTGLPKYLSGPLKYNGKLVLMMPHYPIGSIISNTWDNDNLDILKSLVYQVFINIFLNYHYSGFIYNNLNNNCFEKILIEKTKVPHLLYWFQSPYENIIRMFRAETLGYKAMINDFEDCYYVHKKDGIEDYWKSIYNLINSVQTDLIDNNYMISINNFKTITNFIKKQMDMKGDYNNSIRLNVLLSRSKYKIIKVHS